MVNIIILIMKYKFCEQLQRCIFFDSNSIVHCCNCSQFRDTTYKENYNGEKIDWVDLINNKLKMQEEAKKGIIPYDSCKNCHMWREEEWQEGGYLNEIIISHWEACNCNCYYCFTAPNKKASNSFKHYDLFPIIQDLKKSGYMDFSKNNGGIVRFLGGDLSMLKRIDKMINLFLDAGAQNIYLPTSGIKYMPILEKVLKQGKGEVIISPDSGNRELYKKIKRVDSYEKVKKHMEKYAKAAKKGNSSFKSKYIVIPYVNDTKEQIDEWIKECLNLGIEHIADDFEDNFSSKYSQQIPKHIPELLEYIHKRASETGLKITRFRYATQLLYELEQGLSKISEDDSFVEEQKIFTENLLKR